MRVSKSPSTQPPVALGCHVSSPLSAFTSSSFFHSPHSLLLTSFHFFLFHISPFFASSPAPLILSSLSSSIFPFFPSSSSPPTPVSNGGRLEKAQLLLDYGADPNLRDSRGWSLLHQCAHNGDLPLLQLAVQKGGKVSLRNNDRQLPVEHAYQRGHAPLVIYLDRQSCDLRSLCRLTIREAMGKRMYHHINTLPLPPQLKLFLNYGSPYAGFSATVVPSCPWNTQQLREASIPPNEVRDFIRENASEEFIREHSDSLRAGCVEGLVEALESLYLWEGFKRVGYEEPAARPPRYSMEPRKEEEEEEEEELEGKCCISHV